MPSVKKIAVAGATGRVGHHVTSVLTERGHDVVPMSRSQGVDVITGDGLAAALAGVECIIDAVAGPSAEQQAATAFFTTAARNLHRAGQRAGVQRMIVVSVIGTDRFTAGYGPAKIAHERAMLAGLPQHSSAAGSPGPSWSRRVVTTVPGVSPVSGVTPGEDATAPLKVQSLAKRRRAGAGEVCRLPSRGPKRGLVLAACLDELLSRAATVRVGVGHGAAEVLDG